MTWLYRFERPAAAHMGRVWEILEEMPVAPQNDGEAPKGYRRRDANAELTRRELIRRLRRSLDEDYAENAADYATGNIGFDYVASLDASCPGNVAVMTRLYERDEADTGNIYYGCEIRRIAEDRYLLWGDD